VSSSLGGELLSLRVAPYRERDAGDGSLTKYAFDGLPLGGRRVAYSSYYTPQAICCRLLRKPVRCQSPAGRRSSLGCGVLPRAYHIRPDGPTVENLGPIFGLIGNVYPVFAMHYRHSGPRISAPSGFATPS